MKETIWTALLGSFVRKIVTLISGTLLASGWINAELQNRLTTEAVTMITAGIVSFAISSYLSYRNVIWEFVKTQIARISPPSVSMERIAEIAHAVEDKAAVAKGEIDSSGINAARKDF